MGFLSRLFGANDDRTRAWPLATGPSPQMKVERQALESFAGRLTLGDPLDAARVLGRPDTCKTSGAWTVLRYERWGLVLEFEEEQLFSVEFLIRERDPSGEFEAVEPLGADDQRLTPHTTKADLLQRFGPPAEDHSDPGGDALFYTRPPMVLLYVLDGQQRLASWKVSVNI